jgi:hypothetical protein
MTAKYPQQMSKSTSIIVLVRWENVSLVEPIGEAKKHGQGQRLFYT